MLKEYKNSNSLKKMNYLLLKSNIINPKNNKSKSENTPFPSIQNSLHKVNNGKKNNNNSIIYIKFRNKDIKNACSPKRKLYKNTINKINNFSERIKKNIDNKLQKEEKNDIKKINSNNKCNNSYESKKIINDNYNKYLNDISSTDSNKSKDSNRISSVNKNIFNKIISKKMKQKTIHIKKGIFNLNKNKLNISIIENQDNKEKKEILKNNFFKDNKVKNINFKSILLRFKNILIDNKNNPEINQNGIFNPLIRENLFHKS